MEKPDLILELESYFDNIFELIQFNSLKELLNNIERNRMGYTLNKDQEIIGLSLLNQNIIDIDFLEHFPNLILLGLGKNSISDIWSIGQLKNLKYLYLSDNQTS